jgi:hypothetical protein
MDMSDLLYAGRRSLSRHSYKYEAYFVFPYFQKQPSCHGGSLQSRSIQFYVDDVRTPIEDTSVKWDTPLLKVAELRIPKCTLDSEQGMKLTGDVNKLSFSPWHTTEDHHPIGNVMRARRVAYEASSAFRGHAPEPTSML